MRAASAAGALVNVHCENSDMLDLAQADLVAAGRTDPRHYAGSRPALAAPVVGCASSDEGKSITYSLTAKQNYDKGMEELKEENYPEATRFFSFVKQKFPFSNPKSSSRSGHAV